MALAILLWSVTIVMAGGRLPAWRDSGQLWGGGLLAAWEVFAWSLLFSLRLDRPLVAAVLGVLVPSVFVHVAAPAVVGFDYHSVGLRHYLAIVPWRVAIAAVVSAADVWLASRWLRDSRPMGDSDADSAEDTGLADRGRISQALAARLRGGFWRLVWQHWLDSRWMAFAIGFGYVCVAVLATQAAGSGEWNVIPLGWLVPAAALWGVTVFLADQRRHAYRFFAERGVNPRQVWLSRQIVGAAPVVVGLAAALVFWALCPQFESGRTLRWPPTDLDSWFAGGAICCVLLAYAAGQACSMLFRSRDSGPGRNRVLGRRARVLGRPDACRGDLLVVVRAADSGRVARGDVAASAGLDPGEDQLVGSVAAGFDARHSGSRSRHGRNSGSHLRDPAGRAGIRRRRVSEAADRRTVGDASAVRRGPRPVIGGGGESSSLPRRPPRAQRRRSKRRRSRHWKNSAVG